MFDTAQLGERLLNAIPVPPASERQPLQQLRAAARAELQRPGPITIDAEAWRETSLRPLDALAFRAPGQPAVFDAAEFESNAWCRLPWPRLVTVDGVLREDLSTAGLLRGVSIRELASDPPPEFGSLAQDALHPFTQLNTAAFPQGTVITVDRTVPPDQTLLLLQLTSQAAGSAIGLPRTWVRIEQDADLTLVECFVGGGEGPALVSAVTELDLAAGARLRYARIQDQPLGSFHFGRLAARVAANAQLTAFQAGLGAALSRCEASVLLGPDAQCTLDGLYALAANQHNDQRCLIDHAEPRGRSHQNYRGVLRDEARSVFTGRILVRPGAQKTDAIQHNGNLLLSERALAQSRPQLEIHADDVKCTHGATVGRLSPEALFYLRSRGLAAEQARQLLIEAFAADAIPGELPLQLREALLGRLRQRVGAAEPRP
jgi:Fe-S cluster assembly protein SufD